MRKLEAWRTKPPFSSFAWRPCPEAQSSDGFFAKYLADHPEQLDVRGEQPRPAGHGDGVAHARSRAGSGQSAGPPAACQLWCDIRDLSVTGGRIGGTNVYHLPLGRAAGYSTRRATFANYAGSFGVAPPRGRHPASAAVGAAYWTGCPGRLGGAHFQHSARPTAEWGKQMSNN